MRPVTSARVEALLPSIDETRTAVASGRGRSQGPSPVSACGRSAQTGRSKKDGSQKGVHASVRAQGSVEGYVS